MISIDLETGRMPGVLAALADATRVDKLVKVAAQTYVDETLDWIDAGKAFVSRTGILEQSIAWRSVGGDSAEVFAGAEYAGFVEFGTRAHVIEPKPGRSALKFAASGGGFLFAKKVKHPGSRAHPFFFADKAKREGRMQSAMISVLAAQAGL